MRGGEIKSSALQRQVDAIQSDTCMCWRGGAGWSHPVERELKCDSKRVSNGQLNCAFACRHAAVALHFCSFACFPAALPHLPLGHKRARSQPVFPHGHEHGELRRHTESQQEKKKKKLTAGDHTPCKALAPPPDNALFSLSPSKHPSTDFSRRQKPRGLAERL